MEKLVIRSGSWPHDRTNTVIAGGIVYINVEVAERRAERVVALGKVRDAFAKRIKAHAIVIIDRPARIAERIEITVTVDAAYRALAGVLPPTVVTA